MANRRSLKSDESFLEKLAIGATGARAVFQDLKQKGHSPVELERGSMSYKIWKRIKIKRVRVPDILCLNCGKRFESRAKKRVELSMSHSFSDPERGWDKGLHDSDYVALSVCEKNGERPVDWQAKGLIQYTKVGDMRSAFKRNCVKVTTPKAPEEGSEVRVIWPCAVASAEGVVVKVSESRIHFKRKRDSRTISVSLKKHGLQLTPLVHTGQEVYADQIIGSVVPISLSLPCTPKARALTSYFLELLESLDVSDRYTAAKALAHLHTPGVTDKLLSRMRDDCEHIYVRLEIAAGLARAGHPAGMQFVKNTLVDPYPAHRLEAVIALGEIRSSAAASLLTDVLKDCHQLPDIRAGAAWALGELEDPVALDVLIQAFAELSEPIRIEAARALRKIFTAAAVDISDAFTASTEDQRAGIAWALSRSPRLNSADLIRLMVDDDARRWVAYILGSQNPDHLTLQIEEIRQRDEQVYFAVTVLWKIYASWIHRLDEY